MGREEGTPLRNTAEDSKTNYGTARDLSYFIDPDSGDEEDNLYHISLDKELRRQKLIVIFTMFFCLLLMSTTVIVGLQLQNGQL